MAKRVAVIAVHGVADQQPNDSARQVASLLTDFSNDCNSVGEDRLHIPVDPVLPPVAEEKRSERSEWVRARLRERKAEPCAERTEKESPSYQFMLNLLTGYKKDEKRRAFDTIRVRLQKPDREIDVYEAYWADLSRLGSGIVVFFTQLYQLLLHLPSLGRVTVDHEAVMQGSTASWRFFSSVQAWAVRTLTLGVALMNLALATLIAPLVASHYVASWKPNTQWLLSAGVVALLFLAAAGFFLRLRGTPTAVWYLTPPLAGGLGAYAGYVAAQWIGGAIAIALLAWLIGALLAGLLNYQYELRRPHAMVVGTSFTVITVVVFGWCLWKLGEPGAACMKAFVFVDALLTLVWSIHITLIVLAAIAGLLAILGSCKERKREARQTAWTGRATLALSTALFANLTLAGWMAITKGLIKLLGPEAIHVVLFGNKYNLQTAIDNVLLPNVRLGFVAVAVTTALLIIALVWSIFPSVIDEANPPDATDSLKPGRSERLGKWLSTGLNALPLAVNVFTLTWLVVFVAGVYHTLSAWGHPWHEIIFATDFPALAGSSLLYASGALLVLMIGTQIWLPAADGTLDVALDVDNYLREHPSDDTPRARFAERFVSVFRHVSHEEYDAVVFVAHSQGTIILTDLLRFLRIHYGKVRIAPKVILFTMGSPLLQLYWRAFPPLYTWLGNDPCLEASVDQWFNYYRSGDYVGRSIWDVAPTWTPLTGIKKPEIEDVCIGAGAHTHYWDGTADEIGKKLGAIIDSI